MNNMSQIPEISVSNGDSDTLELPAIKARSSKSAAVQKLLSRNKGATLTEIMAMTSWQPHSTRAFLTGLRKKGIDLLRETRSGGETCWRIDR
ncbi:MAG: DUF3489 domain-containing protein [Sphingobium sp.]|nr:DUF3489 domain-containing protein [Sphingobium sp.]MBP6110817.1 DUF3489 domain-containing protein [Sphingobium sp.]MBP8671940.1 DUF3489 domain-containing protein [Sphingobium sp.]MBP9157505.1 DUF3489 domain-containing protein [Sphingobium sp.]